MVSAGVAVLHRFEVHDTLAPTPENAVSGDQILNVQENIGLRLAPDQPESAVFLDTSVEPPVLRLNRALASCTLSVLGVDDTGELIPTPPDYPKGTDQFIEGVYEGPGSTLGIFPVRG